MYHTRSCGQSTQFSTACGICKPITHKKLYLIRLALFTAPYWLLYFLRSVTHASGRTLYILYSDASPFFLSLSHFKPNQKKMSEKIKSKSSFLQTFYRPLNLKRIIHISMKCIRNKRYNNIHGLFY